MKYYRYLIENAAICERGIIDADSGKAAKEKLLDQYYEAAINGGKLRITVEFDGDGGKSHQKTEKASRKREAKRYQAVHQFDEDELDRRERRFEERSERRNKKRFNNYDRGYGKQSRRRDWA